MRFTVTRHPRYWTRLASHSASTHASIPYQVFDRSVKRLQKDRAACRQNGERSRTVDYVRDEVADRMMERLLVGPDPSSAFSTHV
jgi:NADH dehydrogenase [ubiquinone] 1 alpha subcomplex assembly factor 5